MHVYQLFSFLTYSNLLNGLHVITALYFSEDLLPDLKMEFEVYYTVITSSEAHPIHKAPRASITIRSSSRRQAHFNAPKFCLAGHVQLCVDDISSGMISRDLTMGEFLKIIIGGSVYLMLGPYLRIEGPILNLKICSSHIFMISILQFHVIFLFPLVVSSMFIDYN